MAGLCINYHWNAVPTTIGNMYQLRCSTHRWLSWAKHAGVDKLSVFFVPMEIHSEHICAHKKEYAEYWNSKIDDMIEDVVRNQK